jgi:menaquinone-9 beta-reductase
MARCPPRVSLARLKRTITIAGGGLAGLSLAHGLLTRGAPVTVLEAGKYPRHRVCGEFISGVSQETLAQLGIAPLFHDARSHRSVAWHQQDRLLHVDALPTPALGISRHCLDERLRRQVEAAGGIIQTHTRARPIPTEGQVWAAGRRPKTGPWLGLKGHFRGLQTAADLEMHGGTNGYAGLAGVEDGWVNVCGLFRIDRSITASGADLLPAYLAAGGNATLAAALRRAPLRQESFCAVAGFELGRQASVPGLLCLGDAESIIPPFTGNGMSMAFQAAECAIPPLLGWSRGELAWAAARDEVRAALRRKFRRRLTVASLMQRLLLEPAGQSLLRSLASARALPFRPMLALVR